MYQLAQQQRLLSELRLWRLHRQSKLEHSVNEHFDQIRVVQFEFYLNNPMLVGMKWYINPVGLRKRHRLQNL